VLSSLPQRESGASIEPALELGHGDEDTPATANDGQRRQDVLLEEVDRAAERAGASSFENASLACASFLENPLPG
jgi:hypothetical protein